MSGASQHVDSLANRIDAVNEDLVAISRDIHSHPELNFDEHRAAGTLVRFLASHGFAIEQPVGGLDTAFTATFEGALPGPTIGILAEYDALPDIGHGCGHNLIAMSTVGAGVGLSTLMGTLPGRIVVVGTPGEEGGGGKIKMLDARVFDGIDVCLSSHPSSEGTSGATEWPLEASASLAMVGYRYEFSGVAAHAAASPHLGVNALSAVIALFNGIDSMRQHFTEDVRIHGIITDGGDAPNVVPSYAAANFMLRAHDGAYLENVVSERVRAIADGAARMSGATLEISPIYPFYDNVRPSAHLARRSVEHAKTIGIDLDGQTAGTAISASTDFGNVSQAIPSFAFRFGVSPDFVALHTAEMTKLGDSEYAHKSAVSTAKVLAATAHDLLSDDQFFEDVVGEFAERGKALGRVM